MSTSPIEAITLDEAAVRCRLSREAFEKHYTGPRVKIGREVRIKLAHLDEWLDRRAGLAADAPGNKWGNLDDDGEDART
jgi:hypothetical protein